MKLNWLTYSAGIVLVLASFTACNDLDLAPTNKFTELNYWTSDAKASAVLVFIHMRKLTACCYHHKQQDKPLLHFCILEPSVVFAARLYPTPCALG